MANPLDEWRYSRSYLDYSTRLDTDELASAGGSREWESLLELSLAWMPRNYAARQTFVFKPLKFKLMVHETMWRVGEK